MTPTVIDSPGEGDVHKGAPLRSLRLLKELHPCLVRETISLAGIARDAGADDIFPSGLSSSVTGQHMVDIEMTAVKMLAAVLAGVFIPFKDIESRKLDLLLGEAIKEAEDDDPWHTDAERDRLQHPGLRIREGKITPA